MSYHSLVTDDERKSRHVEATSYRLPHDFLDSQFQGIIAASDGKTYFGMSCHAPEHNGQFYSFDPRTESVEHIADLGAWAGETETVGVANTQGKTHSNIYEAGGKLYLTTTSGHFTEERPYNGGHFLAYDLKRRECIDLAHYPDVNGGGLLTLAYEPVYNRLYAIHQRGCTLIYYDLDTRAVVTLGTVQQGRQTRDLITDRFGNVYGAELDGLVFKYDAEADRMGCLLTRVPHDPGALQPTTAEERGHTFWAQMRWHPNTEWWYGVRRNDEYLFRFRTPPSKRTHIGQAEGLAPFGYLASQDQQPRVGSLALALGQDTIYYCSIERQWPAGRFVDQLQHVLDSTTGVHLMSYDIDKGAVRDHGPVFTRDSRRIAQCHSMALGSDGRLHLAAAVFSNDHEDPANEWLYATRNSCHIHMRLLSIDPVEDLD
jgi:hypothetical protein